MCKVLKVSRAGYYKFLKAEPRRKTNEAIDRFRVRVAFYEHREVYGTRRLQKYLSIQGHWYSRNKLSELMQKESLVTKQRKAFKKGNKAKRVIQIEDLVSRNFNPSKPDSVWVSDITYIRLNTGWSYLCTMLDLYSRRIVGWQLAKRQEASLVVSTFESAFELRGNPEGTDFA